MKNKLKYHLTAIFFIISLFVIGQKAREKNQTELYDISTEKYPYELKVTFPPNFDVKKSYDVLYYLDSWFISDLVTGSYNILNRAEDVRDIVLVGISTKGNEFEFNKQRIMDFTPSKKATLKVEGIEMIIKSGAGENAAPINSETTGGANDFINFLSKKLIPFVENKFPNLNNGRGILGHSYGGLFGTYSIQKQPDLFDNYILISGSLSWNEDELLNEELFNDFKDSSKEHSLYLTYSKAEFSATGESNEKLNQIIKNLGKNNLKYTFEPYEKLSHHSILSRAIYDGIYFTYKK